MKVELSTLRMAIDSRFTGQQCQQESGSVWVARGPGEGQSPILNFALSEVKDLEEGFPGLGSYSAMVRAYFAGKRMGVHTHEDTVDEVAGQTALVRRSFATKVGTDGQPVELFHLFVNVRLDDHFMQEFSADCKAEDREEFEPLFWGAIRGAKFVGDRVQAMAAQNPVVDGQLTALDALVAKAEALAETVMGEPATRRADEPDAPWRRLGPFEPPADGAPVFRLGRFELDLDEAKPTATITAFSHELSINIGGTIRDRDAAEEAGLIDAYNDDGRVKLPMLFKGVFREGGIPAGSFLFDDGVCSDRLINLRVDGLDYGLSFDGRIELFAGWFSLRGQFRCRHDQEQPPFEAEISLPFDSSALDWRDYQFTGVDELRAAPDLVRHVVLRAETLESFPQVLLECRGITHLTISHDGWGTARGMTLPEGLGDLESLLSLNIRGVPLSAVPESLTRLRGLTCLGLMGTGLTSIPAGIWKLAKLNLLFLDGNGLTSIPESIDLPEVEAVDLAGNRLASIPAALVEQPKLRRLKLTDNLLVSLPSAFDVAHSTGRVHLELSSEDRRRFFNFEYTGADGRGVVAWDDGAFLASSSPELLAELQVYWQATELADHQAALLSLIKRAVALSHVAPEDYGSLGNHRFGGMPDLPIGEPYPRYRAEDADGQVVEYAYEFIAQIHCESLAHLQDYLPRTGMLYFFLTTIHDLYGEGAERAAKVLYHPDPVSSLTSGAELKIQEHEYSEMVGDAYAAFQAEATLIPSAPDFYSAHANPHLFRGPSAGLKDQDTLLDEHIPEALTEPLRGAHPHDHAINTYVFTQQEDPENQAALALNGQPEDWVTLLKVGSVGDFQWGDAGDLFFVIHKSDLQRGDFTNVYCGLESS